MKALKLAVAESSAILRCGIIALLHRMPAANVDILEIGDISQLAAQLGRQLVEGDGERVVVHHERAERGHQLRDAVDRVGGKAFGGQADASARFRGDAAGELEVEGRVARDGDGESRHVDP